MSSDPNDFEALRRLMALKRHEQPPSEYLDDLSGSIISRIEAGEGRLSLFDKISGGFAMHPALACAAGLTVCGSIGLTAIYYARHTMQQQAQAEAAAAAVRSTSPRIAMAAADEANIPVANWLRYTNPISDNPPTLSLFDTPHNTVLVSYHRGN